MACCMKLIGDTGCLKLIDDTEGPSMLINSYAVFMGYLSMAIKGIGFLILTWTTVVLLGGFVSIIDTRDFWCLTFITLVQTAGIFDVYLNEKLSYILYSAIAFLGSPWFAFMGKNFSEKDFEKKFPVALIVRSWLACIFVVVQMLVFSILLCTLAAVYVFGVLISAGISLWRLVLVQHSYRGNLNETTNLKPALYTLYCLAIFQGALFLYRFTFARVGKKIAKVVFKCGDDELKAILTYLDETKIGCEKNPSFARGRNFITHAIELICSKSLDDCFSGVQLLYTSICIWERRLKAERAEKKFYVRQWKDIIRQHMLRKKLIVSASSSSVLQRVLLQTLNPQGMYNRETRNQSAKIVVYLAIDIHLEEFPHGIQYISTLIGTFEEYRLMEPYHIDRLIHKYDQGWDRQANQLPLPGPDNDKLREAYEKLVLQGMCILRKLATYENNCIIMSKTQGLLLKIMAPLTSDLIHQFNGGTWSIMVVEASLKVMHLLVATPGETGTRMTQEISNNKEAVRTMERILSCDYCHVKLRKQAMWILIQLYMETKSMPTFIKMLGDIFVDSGSRDRSIRKLAGEALVKLCQRSGSNTSIILQVDGDVVGSLTNILLDVKNKTCRIRAAEILEHMCNIHHHTQDDECLSKLKEAMTTTMPQVLAEILCYELSKDETQATIEAGQIEVVVKEDDIEYQCDDPQENAQDKTSSSTHPKYKENEEDVDIDEDESENEEDEDEKIYTPLLSLCVKVCDTFIGADQDLACRFGTTSLPKKLEEMVKKNNVSVVSCLRLIKLTCKMVISMMNHSGNYNRDDLDSLMNAVSSASESMCHLDASMVFASQDDGAQTMKPVRSLSSLMEEAKRSVEMRRT